MENNSVRRWLRHTVAPIVLILGCPVVVFAVCTANLRTRGSLSNLYDDAVRSTNDSSLLSFLKTIGLNQGVGSPIAWKILSLFVVMQLIILWFSQEIGKKDKEGSTASDGIPMYKANGLAAFFVTMMSYVVLSVGFGVFPATVLYDNFRELMWVAMITSFLLCFWLTVRGRGNSSAAEPSGNNSLLMDFYWGREVNPSVFGLELKQVTNCRFGMMLWPLIVITCLAKQWQLYGYISNSLATASLLQLAYIAKFFHWEAGYTRTLDMMHDRAGYYICWGCMIWVPCIYPSQIVYLVSNPINLHPFVAAALTAIGLLCIGLNYHADWQKQEVRKSDGQCLIWGKPPKMIRAKYSNGDDEKCSQILLLSGWWGVSRHFHYIPEIGAALCWTLPCQFEHWLPYFYVLYLTFLLVDRTNRDDLRCLKKYKSYWKQYSEKVPYKIIPYVY